MKWLLSGDQQIPFHDKRAIDLWFKVVDSFKPDVLDYLGDTDDQACYSRWTDGRSAEFLARYKEENALAVLPYIQAESKETKKFYEKTREALPNAEIHVALGNHDIRIFDYVDKKLREIAADVTPNFLWGLDDYGIDYIFYKDSPKKRYGGYYVHHGLAISKHAGESVKADIDNYGVSLIRGHSHRLASISRSYPLREETLSGFELGHMMDVSSSGASYDNVHNWQQGFAYGYIDGDYAYISLVEIKPDYTCYVDGVKFTA